MDEAQKISRDAGSATPGPPNQVEQYGGPVADAPPSGTSRDVRTMADDAAEKAGAAASEAGERVKEKAKEAGDKVKEQGRTFLIEQKERVGSEIETYSEAARRAADRLESESDTNLSSYVSSAADHLDRLATRVRERDLGELVDDAEEMARRRPEVFYGGMFVAGLVAARFLKASKEKRVRERLSTSDGGRRERTPYGTRRARPFAVSPEPALNPTGDGGIAGPSLGASPSEKTERTTGGNI